MVKFHTGSKVCELHWEPNGCKSRTDGKVRMRKDRKDLSESIAFGEACESNRLFFLPNHKKVREIFLCNRQNMHKK